MRLRLQEGSLLGWIFLIPWISLTCPDIQAAPRPLPFINSDHASPINIEAETGEKTVKKTKAYKPGITIVPLLYYTPETRIAFGAGGNINYRLGPNKKKARPSSLWLTAIYTQNKQYQLSLKPEIYLNNNSIVLAAYIKQERFPQKFFGVGNGLGLSVSGETYTPEDTLIQLSASKRIWKALYGGVQYEAEFTKIKNLLPGGLLDTGEIYGVEGGLASGLGFNLTWDNRDSIYFPRHGQYLSMVADAYVAALGSDFLFRSLKLDLRSYLPFASNHALGLQLYMRITSGSPPFYRLSMLGGDTILRGYYKGLYRDKNLIALQAEYRAPVSKRFGVAGFVGLGKVGSRLSDLLPSGIKSSIGTGFRYKFDIQEGANIRLDFAWGKGTFGMYITAREAF